MTNITYILSQIDKAIAFEWIVNEIDATRFNLSFLLLNDKNTDIEEFLLDKKVPFHRIPFTSKKDYPKAIIQTRKHLKKLRSDVVHCHMRDANFIGLTAAKSLGIKKRIYTRHFSTYNHEYFPKAVKFDKLTNALATDIIAISNKVKDTLVTMENVPEDKISLIHHGFKLEGFHRPNLNDVEKLKIKYNPQGKSPVIGVIARRISWKGYQYIIPALAKIKDNYPNALFIFANSSGAYKDTVDQLIRQYIPDNTVEIEFEKDLFSLYHLFDIYLHTPINASIEAFGQTYVEALASGVPSVFTLSGIAHDFIEHKKNALVVDYKNSEQITEAVAFLLSNDKVRDSIALNGRDSVQRFNLDSFISKLEKLYA